MSRLYSSRAILSALQRAGFSVIAQRGSHVKLRGRRGGLVRTVMLKHPAREVPAGTFAAILRQAGLSREEFEGLL